jgi:hypothetical protein
VLQGILADESVRTLFGLAALGWPAAFVALLLRRPGLAGALAVVALIPELARAVEDVRIDVGLGVVPLLWLAVRVLPVLALVACHGAAPPPRRRTWSIAVLVTAGVQLVVTAPWYLPYVGLDESQAAAEAIPVPPTWFALVFLDQASIQAIALAVATAVHLVARQHGRRFGSAGWTLTLAMLAAVVGVLRAVTLSYYLTLPGDQNWIEVGSWPAVILPAGVAQLALAAAAFVVLATLARADLPANDDGPAPVRGAGPPVSA